MADFCRIRISFSYDDVFLSQTTYSITTGEMTASRIAQQLEPGAFVEVEKVYETSTYEGVRDTCAAKKEGT